jgi:predicted nucleic acid-binding protein
MYLIDTEVISEALDKQIAATALINDLTVVTRNVAHYSPTGVRLLKPFD